MKGRNGTTRLWVCICLDALLSLWMLKVNATCLTCMCSLPASVTVGHTWVWLPSWRLREGPVSSSWQLCQWVKAEPCMCMEASTSVSGSIDPRLGPCTSDSGRVSYMLNDVQVGFYKHLWVCQRLQQRAYVCMCSQL